MSHYVQVPYLFTFHYIFSVPLCASSPFFYISLYLQCPILGKFPIYLHSIRYSVSHFGQVPYLFTFHQIFSVPLCASSLSFYLSLYLQFPIMCKFPKFLCFVISSVSHSGQVPYSFTFHYIFSVPLCASSPYFYISFYIQCPILCKFPNFLCFVISSVSHCGQVPNNFVLHYIFSVPLCASSLSIYISLDLQCPIMCKFSIFFHFIISLVSHFGQVPYLFTFHKIFSVPFWASSLSIYISLYLQCPIWGKFPIYLHSIRSSVSHYVHVPYLFTFHYFLCVPLCASSPSFYIPLYLQCPILGKYPIALRFIISSVSHYVHVPYLFTFRYIFSVPLCASTLSFYVSLYLQCPIMCKFPTFVTFHYIFNGLITSKYPIITFNYIFRMSLCGSSLSIYISSYLQCPILGKFPIYLHFIISAVSDYVQVHYLFTFHYIFSVPLCASTLQFYISLYLQCPIMCTFSIFVHFIISLVSHFGQVPYIFTFHQIFSVPFWASSLSIYISLDLQCLIMCKFSIFFHFIISLVSHLGQVPYLFTFHYIFSVPFGASSLSFYLSLYLQFPILMCQFPPFDTFHYIFSVPFWASTQQFYVSLYLQCPIMSKYPLILCFIIYLVSHYVQVLHLFTFHYIFSVPFWASTLQLYVSLYLQCPIMCKFPTFVTFHYIFNDLITSKYPIIMFNYIFRMSLCASSLSIYISLYLQCPILGKFPIYLRFIISSVSHYVQVHYLFTFHYIFSVPFWASTLQFYVSLDLQCPIMSNYPIIFVFHLIFSVPLCASTLSFYVSLYLQCPVICKFPTFVTFHYILNGLITSKYPIITFNYIFRMS